LHFRDGRGGNSSKQNCTAFTWEKGRSKEGVCLLGFVFANIEGLIVRLESLAHTWGRCLLARRSLLTIPILSSPDSFSPALGKTKTGLVVACKCMIRNPKNKDKDKVLIRHAWYHHAIKKNKPVDHEIEATAIGVALQQTPYTP